MSYAFASTERVGQNRFFLAALREARRTTLVSVSIVALLMSGASVVSAQSALDGFDPNANGAMRVIVVQPDGKTLIGGEFTTLALNSGAIVTRNQIARLNPDGTVDAAFDPNANGAVYAMRIASKTGKRRLLN